MASKVNRRRFLKSTANRDGHWSSCSRMRDRPLRPRTLLPRLLYLYLMLRQRPHRPPLALNRSAAAQHRK